jgi:hypothetical protein
MMFLRKCKFTAEKAMIGYKPHLQAGHGGIPQYYPHGQGQCLLQKAWIMVCNIALLSRESIQYIACQQLHGVAYICESTVFWTMYTVYVKYEKNKINIVIYILKS